MLAGHKDDRKPLFRQWSKENPSCTDVVEHIRLSASEEWIMLECSECVALISYQSKVGQAFWQQVLQFQGKSLGLEVIPAKGKLGFDVQPSAIPGVWEWVDDNKVEFSDGLNVPFRTGLTSDLWDKMVREARRIIEEDETTKERTGNNPSNGRANNGNRRKPKPEAEAPESDA